MVNPFKYLLYSMHRGLILLSLSSFDKSSKKSGIFSFQTVLYIPKLLAVDDAPFSE